MRSQFDRADATAVYQKQVIVERSELDLLSTLFEWDTAYLSVGFLERRVGHEKMR